MSLYRIMLVDDEEEVRKAMIRKMDWEQLGFTVAGDAENGEDALEKLEMLEPDVVMTDIRMPYMDGLTLVAKIREKYPFIKILIFSGYDDFEYAKQAIKYRVTEYILKPVNGEELSEILTRVRISLDEEIEQRRNISALQESYENSLPMLRELFLNDLVRRGCFGDGAETQRVWNRHSRCPQMAGGGDLCGAYRTVGGTGIFPASGTDSDIRAAACGGSSENLRSFCGV